MSRDDSKKIEFHFKNNDGTWIFIPTPFIENDCFYVRGQIRSGISRYIDVGLAFLNWNIRIRFKRGKKK